MPRKTCLLFGIVGLLALWGCQPNNPEMAQHSTARTGASMELMPVDANRFQAWLAEQQGHWVLVDFWATWCAPCKEKIPHVVALDRQFRDRGLIVVAISMDEPDDSAKVAAFLEQHGATFTGMIRAQPMGPAFEGFGLTEIPTYRVFTPEGRLEREFSGEFEFQELNDLLSEKLRASVE